MEEGLLASPLERMHLHNLETQRMASDIPALCYPASIVSQLNKMGDGMGELGKD